MYLEKLNIISKEFNLNQKDYWVKYLIYWSLSARHPSRAQSVIPPNDSRYFSRAETIRLGRQSRSTITKFVAPTKTRWGVSGRGTGQNKEAKSIWWFHRQLCRVVVNGRGAYSYLTPMCARGARLVDHRRESLARHPICAKLSMIEWHEIENSAFSVPVLLPGGILSFFLSSPSRLFPIYGKRPMGFLLYQFNRRKEYFQTVLSVDFKAISYSEFAKYCV